MPGATRLIALQWCLDMVSANVLLRKYYCTYSIGGLALIISDSRSSDRKVVEVQVLSPVPEFAVRTEAFIQRLAGRLKQTLLRYLCDRSLREPSSRVAADFRICRSNESAVARTDPSPYSRFTVLICADRSGLLAPMSS